MKRFLHVFGVFTLFCTFHLTTYSEVPVGYYEGALGKSGKNLKTALSSILSDCGSVSYDGLYSVYKTSDNRDGKVWDMYSATTNYTFGQTCGNYKNEGDCFNREHSVPQSWFGSQKPMVSDAWHVYPTDGKVNGMRSNFPFGEVGNATYTSNESFSKVGSSKTSGYSGTVFEPNDEYKGDFARAYFYMATRYEGRITNWGGIFVSTYPNIVKWQLDMLLRWSELDPISDKEIERNDAVYSSAQRNRNPFIDYPELVDLIFGDRQGEVFNPGEVNQSYLISPVNNSTFTMGSIPYNTSVTKLMVISGKNIDNPVNLTLEGGADSLFQIGKQILSASEVNNSYELSITYNAKVSGTHSTVLKLSGTGMKDTRVTLTGVGVDGFAAIEASNITPNSFVANWTAKNGATDYEVTVYSVKEDGDTEEKVIFTEDFLSENNKWNYINYTNIESGGGLRLGSGKQDGAAQTPALDLSGSNIFLYLKSKPFGSDRSELKIDLDGNLLTSISYPGSSIEKTIPVTGGKVNSKLTFSAIKGKRVILEQLVVKGGNPLLYENVPGYPQQTGLVLSHAVEGLQSETEYFYTVTPLFSETRGETSNEVRIETTTGTSLKPDMSPEDQILIYSDNNELQIINAPVNSKLQLFNIAGTLIMTRTLHDEFEQFPIYASGIYIVQITSPNQVRSEKILIP